MLVQVDIKVFFTFELVKELTGMHGLEASFLALDLRVLLFHCFRNFNKKIRYFLLHYDFAFSRSDYVRKIRVGSSLSFN